jgi:hypothetical protein
LNNNLELLKYPQQEYNNYYLTAQPRPGIGVCIAHMQGGVMLQFFPWIEGESGHGAYAKFLVSKATKVLAADGELFVRYPFFVVPEDDMLLVKCMIEEGLNQVELWNEHQDNPTDATAREALE